MCVCMCACVSSVAWCMCVSVTKRAYVCTNRCSTNVIRWVSSATGLVAMIKGLSVIWKLDVSARLATSELPWCTCSHSSVPCSRHVQWIIGTCSYTQLFAWVLETHSGPQVYRASAPTQWAHSTGSSTCLKPVFCASKYQKPKYDYS